MEQEASNHSNSILLSNKDVYEQVKLSMQEGNHSVAQKVAKKYLVEAPDNDDLRMLLVKSLWSVNNYSEAIEHLETLVVALPKDIEISMMLATAYRKTDRLKDAIRIYTQILGKYPRNIVILNSLAEVYETADYKKSAYNIYKHILELSETTEELVQVNFKLARLGKGLGNYNKAIENIAYVIDQNPNNYEALKLYKELCILLEDYKTAETITKKIIEYAPEGLDMTKEFIELYCVSERYSEALSLAIDYLPNIETDVEGLRSKILQIVHKKHLSDTAVDYIKKALIKYPSNVVLLETLIDIHKLSKKYAEAAETYENLMSVSELNRSKYSQELSSLFGNWAKDLKQEGLLEEAAEKLNNAILYNPLNAAIYNELGKIYVLRDEYSKAIIEFNKAKDLMPSNCDYLFNLANSYELNKENQKAIEFYNKVLKISPEHKAASRNLKLLSIL